MTKMPVLFAGHGSPMNAIEDNPHTKAWEELGQALLKNHPPKQILVISAHWESKDTLVHADPNPKQIYDMYGFPQALYDLRYRPPGSPELARRCEELTGAALDFDWGIDHGTWSVLCRMFPNADIPTLQLSIAHNAPFSEAIAIGEKLRPLREEGVLIMGSGNVVHNLRTIDWKLPGGYDYCERFDCTMIEAVKARDFETLLHPPLEEDRLRRSFLSNEHYVPLLYAIGAATAEDEVSVFNDDVLMGSISMTSFLFSAPQ